MTKLSFFGYNNEIFGEYGATNQELNKCSSAKSIQCMVDCGELGRVLVVGQYNDVSMGNCCWLIGVTKVDGWDDFPDWNFRYEESVCEYSPALLMDLPDGDFSLEWFIDGKKVEL